MKEKNRIWSWTLLVTGLMLISEFGCKKTDTVPTDKALTNVADMDGNVYKTVTIGSQVWMAENLKTTKYENGDLIGTTALDIEGESSPKYQWAFGDDMSVADIYGRLYTWYAATDGRNVCPSGWHVPTDGDWEILKLYLGGDSLAGGKLKESGTNHWQTPNTGATNEVGFNVLPAGYRNLTGSFVSLQISSYHWSSTPNPTPEWSWGQRMGYNDGILLRGGYFRKSGASIRCIKN